MDGVELKTVEEWQMFGDPTLVIGEESLPPEKPVSPEGPASGGINKELTFQTSTIDPENDDIYYLFDWGDDEFSGWIGPYKSGNTAEVSYTWTEKGEYEIRVKAKDEHGVQSEWSDPLQISLTKTKITSYEIINNFIEKLLNNVPMLEEFIQIIVELKINT
jgi:hypothetical protein